MSTVEGLARCARLMKTPCGDGDMVWRVWGEGPPLVFLHGGYGSWAHWVRTIPAFMGRYTVYVPDIPGLGESDEAPPPGDPPAIAAVVADGLIRLGLDTAALDLIGFSFGALIGGHVAVRVPLRSLIIVGAGALSLPRENIMLLREDAAMSEAERRAIHKQNLALLMIADPSRIDDQAVAIQAENVGRARVKSRRFAETGSLTGALAAAKPRYFSAIWGEGDAVVGPFMASREAYIRGLRDDAGFHIIPDAGHWVAYEAPEAFNALLHTILAAHPRP